MTSSHHFPTALVPERWYSLWGHPTSACVYKSGVAGGTRRSLSHANDKASGVIFQNGAATYSVDGTARYYLASWGRTHLTLSRGRACAQKGRSQRQRISYLSPRERTRHGIPAIPLHRARGTGRRGLNGSASVAPRHAEGPYRIRGPGCALLMVTFCG